MSARRSGHIALIPPTRMPTEPKLVKPHSAQARISRLRPSSAAPPPPARSRYATNSFTTTFRPSSRPACAACSAGTPMIQASGVINQPATSCSVRPVSGVSASFTSATSATNTISVAMMPSNSCRPSAVPRTTASTAPS